MRGSFSEILAPNLFSFDKCLGGVARFKILSDPLPAYVVSRDFESRLSVYAFTNYSECVRSLALCSYGRKVRIHALHFRLSGHNWQWEICQKRRYYISN